ncbi:MAG: hypothetical protein LBL56_05165 [Treponema sp.]|jgi:hypothetical protein|nr:hypothetical protein [Treponema sp.]
MDVEKLFNEVKLWYGKGAVNTAASPGMLELMIADYPGTAGQKEKAYAAAMEYVARHGEPPYYDVCLAMGLLQAVLQAARSAG